MRDGVSGGTSARKVTSIARGIFAAARPTYERSPSMMDGARAFTLLVDLDVHPHEVMRILPATPKFR